MVHGGGHHHHSSSSGSHHHQAGNNSYFDSDRDGNDSDWWFNRSYQTSAWWSGGSRQSAPHQQFNNARSLRSPGSNDSMSFDSTIGDCDNSPCEQVCACCCTVACGAVCGLLCCGAATQNPNGGTSGDGISRTFQSMSTGGSRANRNPFCPWLGFSTVLFIFLFATSSLDQHWTLNGGETRQISDRMLNKAITVTTGSSLAKGRPVANVYSIQGDCPELTGPPVILRDKQILTLARDEYQYDYFYLTPGSELRVDTTAIEGSFNVYILKGSSVLNNLEHDREFDVEANAVATAYITPGGSYATSTLSAQATRHQDIYTLLYENASSKQGQIEVTYQVELRTYELNGISPSCELTTECSIPVPNRQSCILVQIPTEDHPPPPPLPPGPDHKPTLFHGPHPHPPSEPHRPIPPGPNHKPAPIPGPHPHPPPLPDPAAPRPPIPPPLPPPGPHLARPIEIDLKITGHRKWMPLLAYAAIPLIFGILRAAFLGNGYYSSTKETVNDNPAFAPGYRPEATATLCEKAPAGRPADESIPLVPADSVQAVGQKQYV